MSAASNDLFYSRLPVNEISLSELLGEEHLFYKVPADWHIVITDIKNSTGAIEKGIHETVNLLATGSIVAVLNIAYKVKISIPFFFGGDGASFIIPSSVLAPVLQALHIHRQNTLVNFTLDLRVGTVPVKEVYDAGHLLQVSKLRSSKLFVIPVLLGDGLAYAEKIIKGENSNIKSSTNEGELDLTGMQCRWDKIRPPQNFDEVVSLLVIARKSDHQAKVFKDVIDLLDEIYGEAENRKPISIPMLKLKATIEKIGLEMKTRFGKWMPLYLLTNWLKMQMGNFYFQTKKGKQYLQELVALSDTLVIDGKINTVISGTAAQRKQLEESLSRLEASEELWYGIHVSGESVMSCYVRSLNEDHIHFVDGAGGGYTKAAGMLKQKAASNFQPQSGR